MRLCCYCKSVFSFVYLVVLKVNEELVLPVFRHREFPPWRTASNRGWSWKALTRSIRLCTSFSLWLRWAALPIIQSVTPKGCKDSRWLKMPVISQTRNTGSGQAASSSSCDLCCNHAGVRLPAEAPFWRLQRLSWLLGERQLSRHPPRRLVWEHQPQAAHP